ncbi:hypothetical protein [Longimicrobium sp.]|uniref:hypothetical protein n=1 Tax=Longimicrobium sp. TaxID=2029185 RepID=UPI003B3B8EAA
MTLLRSLLVAVLAFAVSACGGSSPSLPETDADYGGTLTEFLLGPASLDAPARVLVQRDGSTSPPDRKIVEIGSSTRLYLADRNGQPRRASTDDLQVGDRLLVWTTGVELRSDSGQVFATDVHIIRQELPSLD